MVELASRPGGLPEDPRVILAPGLPGIYAPQSAGALVAEAVIRAMNGEGGSME